MPPTTTLGTGSRTGFLVRRSGRALDPCPSFLHDLDASPDERRTDDTEGQHRQGKQVYDPVEAHHERDEDAEDDYPAGTSQREALPATESERVLSSEQARQDDGDRGEAQRKEDDSTAEYRRHPVGEPVTLRWRRWHRCQMQDRKGRYTSAHDDQTDPERGDDRRFRYRWHDSISLGILPLGVTVRETQTPV